MYFKKNSIELYQFDINKRIVCIILMKKGREGGGGYIFT